MLQNGIIAMVSTLSLFGPGKWKLKKRFQKGVVAEMDKIEFQSPVFDTESYQWLWNQNIRENCFREGKKLNFIEFHTVKRTSWSCLEAKEV
jgi:hypothetical protein